MLEGSASRMYGRMSVTEAGEWASVKAALMTEYGMPRKQCGGWQWLSPVQRGPPSEELPPAGTKGVLCEEGLEGAGVGFQEGQAEECLFPLRGRGPLREGLSPRGGG